jgi:hypothetical protein
MNTAEGQADSTANDTASLRSDFDAKLSEAQIIS